MPLIESLFDSGDLGPDTTAIAYSKDDPAAKNIYVVSTMQILTDMEGVETLDQQAFAEVCRLVSAGTYAAWGNAELFGGSGVHSTASA